MNIGRLIIQRSIYPKRMLNLQYPQVSFVFCMMSKHRAKVQRKDLKFPRDCHALQRRFPRYSDIHVAGSVFRATAPIHFFRMPGKRWRQMLYPTELRDQFFNKKHALLPRRGKGKCFFPILSTVRMGILVSGFAPKRSGLRRGDAGPNRKRL